jgi:hypothetical protein
VPIGFLSEAERERLDSFPPHIVHADLITFFTLFKADRAQLPRTTTACNRLGFALQLGALRYLGSSPDGQRHIARPRRFRLLLLPAPEPIATAASSTTILQGVPVGGPMVVPGIPAKSVGILPNGMV